MLFLAPGEYEPEIIGRLALHGKTPRFLPSEGPSNRLYLVCIRRIRLV